MPVSNSKSNFHFFTDTDLLNTQTTGAYGPIPNASSPSGKDQFRTTSLHSATGIPKAYAICAGQILVQEVTNPNSSGPDIVNLILKPFVQPPFDIGFVQYYVYKGVLKESLLDVVLDEIADETNNDLTKAVWESQRKRDKAIDKKAENPIGTTNNPAPKEALGIHYISAAPINLPPNFDPEIIKLDIDYIENVFFKENSNYELIAVKKGWHIGDFQAGSFGLEVIVECSRSEPNWGLVRTFEHIIEVSSLGQTPTQADSLIHFNQKEAILGFVDPAAFFGSFYGYGLEAKDSLDTKTLLQGEVIYDSCVSKFQNKGLVYLDIRNQLNYSIDYFRNYGRSIKLSTDYLSVPSNIDYYLSGWPIMILDTFSLDPSDTAKPFTIRLQFPIGNNDMPALYLANAKTLAVFPNSLSKEDRFGTFYLESSGGFLDMEVVLCTAHKSGNPIASYVSLQYFNRINVNAPKVPSSGTSLVVNNCYDHLFQPLGLNIPWESNVGTCTKVYNRPIFVDTFNNRGVEFMGCSGVAKDSQGNMTFFVFSVDKIVAHSSIKYPSINLVTIQHKDIYAHQFIEKIITNAGGVVEYYTVEDNGDLYYIKHLTEDKSRVDSSGYPTVKDVLFLELTHDEIQNLELLKNNNLLLEDFPISLTFKTSLSAVPEFSTKYELYLEGYQQLATAPQIEIVSIPTSIFKYKVVENIDFSIHPIMGNINSHKAAQVPVA
jgi:hypothetical protein